MLKPPTLDQLAQALACPPPDGKVLHDYRWLAERYCVNDLGQWAVESLHREYQWKAGLCRPPCRADTMEQVRFDTASLNAEIAKRSVLARPATSPRELQGLATRMQEQAARFLRNGQFAEAAALFQFAVQQDPDDAIALNNLGFCQVPIDIESALFNLERAGRQGYPDPAINMHNRIVCHIVRSQERIARNLAEEFWATHLDGAPVPLRAKLWRLKDDRDLVVVDIADARAEIATVALSLCSNDSERQLWRQRLEVLSGQQQSHP